jgi:uncharacterized protein (DUF885 family)
MKRLILAASLLAMFIPANTAIGLTADGGFAATPMQKCETDLRDLNQVSGWQTAWPQQWRGIAASDGANVGQEIDHWSGASQALDEAVLRLRQGMMKGQTAPAAVVNRVWQQVDDLSIDLQSSETHYFMEISKGTVAERWNDFVQNTLSPAVQTYRDFLLLEYLPAAQDVTGLSDITDGQDCFVHAVNWWTTLDLSTEEIEQKGHYWLEESQKALLETAKPSDDFETILDRLRNFSRTNNTTETELLDISRKALSRAEENLTIIAHHSPGERIVIDLLPEHLRPSFPAGFFRPTNGAQPAAYVINPSRPNERRLMAEVIAFHEGLPGHYLFFAYPTDAEPDTFNSGYVEGWAIYAEYVADELGLFSTTLDRQGMITKHLWSASRLIVEPGLHIHGWTREDAIDFMLERTVMSRTEIEIEVDRYLALPGQSLGYMLGADLLLSERDEAKARLGNRFDPRDFHHVILSGGMRSLPQVQQDIRNWVEDEISKVVTPIPPSALN